MEKKEENGNGERKRPTDERWKIKKKSHGDKYGKKRPSRGQTSLDIYMKKRHGPRQQPMEDMPGVAGPSQRPAIHSQSDQSRGQRKRAFAVTEEEDDDDDDDRLSVISEGVVMSYFKDDGRRHSAIDPGAPDDEVEIEGGWGTGSKAGKEPELLETTPIEMIQDLDEAIKEIKILRGQIAKYRHINEELRQRLAKKDRRMNKLSSDLKHCLSHRAKLEERNGRIRHWLKMNATGWEEVVKSSEDDKTPPPCPRLQKRAATPARGQRKAAIHQMRPGSSESNKSANSSPAEKFRKTSPDNTSVTTDEMLRTPILSPSQQRKRSIYLEESAGGKRRRSSTPPPSVSGSVGADSLLNDKHLPSPRIQIINDEPPQDDDDDDDEDAGSNNSNGFKPSRNGKAGRSAQRRRILGPRPGSFIPPPPDDAPEQPRLWERGQGWTTSLRPLVPLNLNVDHWFNFHFGRI